MGAKYVSLQRYRKVKNTAESIHQDSVLPYPEEEPHRFVTIQIPLVNSGNTAG